MVSDMFNEVDIICHSIGRHDVASWDILIGGCDVVLWTGKLLVEEAVPARFCLRCTGAPYGADASETGRAHRAASTSMRPQRSILSQGGRKPTVGSLYYRGAGIGTEQEGKICNTITGGVKREE